MSPPARGHRNLSFVLGAFVACLLLMTVGFLRSCTYPVHACTVEFTFEGEAMKGEAVVSEGEQREHFRTDAELTRSAFVMPCVDHCMKKQDMTKHDWEKESDACADSCYATPAKTSCGDTRKWGLGPPGDLRGVY